MSPASGSKAVRSGLWILGLTVLTCARLSLGAETVDVNDIAERYVKLVLEVGLYERGYIDAYFGPPEWKPDLDMAQDEFPAKALRSKADSLIAQLEAIDFRGAEEIQGLRGEFLRAQLVSVRGKIDLLDGREMSFDEETTALYDTVLPPFDEKYYQGMLDELDRLLPGQGDLGTRFNAYNRQFGVPRDKVREVIDTTVVQYRAWTREHVTLPAEEGFDIQFVYGKPWMAYLTYLGDGRSRLEVNLSASYAVSEIELVAGHELYPGHHTHMVLLDTHLHKGRGWVEFSVMPFNSPLASISEGLAEYGCHDLVADPTTKTKFRREVLFPMLGIDPAEAERYGRVMALKGRFWGGTSEAARRYQDCTMDTEPLTAWIGRYGLVAPGAEYTVFGSINAFGSYLINYSYGRTLVGNYIARKGGTETAARWELFERLLSTPQRPSRLK